MFHVHRIILHLLSAHLYFTVKYGGSFQVPDLDITPYWDLQDINIGLMVSVRRPAVDKYCATEWGSPEQSQLAETLPYVVKQTNARTDILPNITLGYVVLDGCQRDVTALGKSMAFIPRGKFIVLPIKL